MQFRLMYLKHKTFALNRYFQFYKDGTEITLAYCQL